MNTRYGEDGDPTRRREGEHEVSLDSNILSGPSSSATETDVSALTVWGQLPSYVPADSPDFVWAEEVCGADFVHCMETA